MAVFACELFRAFLACLFLRFSVHNIQERKAESPRKSRSLLWMWEEKESAR